MQEVPQRCVTFHRFIVDQLRGSFSLLSPRRSMNCSFSTSPFKELALHGARNRKRKVRLTFFNLLGAQHLQKDAQGLLGNVGSGELRLLLCDAANSAVQHRNKGQNHQRLDELWFVPASRQQRAEQIVG